MSPCSFDAATGDIRFDGGPRLGAFVGRIENDALVGRFGELVDVRLPRIKPWWFDRQPAASVLGPACHPLSWAGVVVGTSLKEDVVALHGEGLEVSPETGRWALAWVDSTRALLMTVEGESSTVSRLTVRPVDARVAETATRAPVSQRTRATERFAGAFDFRIGQPATSVQSDWGAPQHAERRADGTTTWWYEDDYGPSDCEDDEWMGIIVSGEKIDGVVLQVGD